MREILEEQLIPKGMIKNKMKIDAIVENAKKCEKLRKQHGTALRLIEKAKNSYKKNPLFNPSLEEAFRRFNRIGKTTSGWLAALHNAKKSCIIVEVPE